MNNDEFFKQQGNRIRAIAEKADPFTKKRLLALARSYDDRRPSPPLRLQINTTHSSAILRTRTPGEQ